MRLDDLIQELVIAWNQGGEDFASYPVTVRLRDEDIAIDQLEIHSDGIRLHLEYYPDYDLDEATRNGQG
jgi:hypothetical protein